MSRKDKRKPGAGKRPLDRGYKTWSIIFLALFSFLLYANTLGHGFVFDDITLILQNPQVQEFDLSGIFSLQGYRPVRTLTHALEWALFGENPMVFHLNNILLHMLNVLLLFLFLGRLTRSRLAALAGAVFFMVHPVQTAAVAYVSGRKDLLATFFLLLGFWLYTRTADPRQGRRWIYPAAWACFFLALLSKEVAIVFPVLLLGLEMLPGGEKKNGEEVGERTFGQAMAGALRRRPLQYAVFSILAVSALFWAVFINLASRTEEYWGGTFVTNLGTGVKLFSHYLKLVFFPHPLIADYTGSVFPVPESFFEPVVLLSVLLALVYGVITVWVFRRDPLFSMGMLWFAAALSPVLHFIPFHELAADHFLYFPLAGAAMSLAALFKLLDSSSKQWRKAGISILVTLTIVGGTLTINRNKAWKNQKTLWETTYEQAPDSYRANVNLGQIAFSEQRMSEGIKYTEKAIQLDPEKAVPRSNLGALYYNFGQQASMAGNYTQAKEILHKAIEYCKAALELDPERIFTAINYGSAYKELANIAEAEGDPDLAGRYRREAERFYMRALNSGDQRKELKTAWLNLGLMKIDAGRYQEAIAILDRFIESYGEGPVVWRGYFWKGHAQYTLGYFQEAAVTLEEAASRHLDMDVLNALVNCYEKIGDEEKKIQTFQRALTINPNSFNALYNLGLIFRERGDSAKSTAYFKKALEADPDNNLAGEIRRYLQAGEERN